jgi:glycerol dehydrogenase-like iron-containing ADH family enzyme
VSVLDAGSSDGSAQLRALSAADLAAAGSSSRSSSRGRHSRSGSSASAAAAAAAAKALQEQQQQFKLAEEDFPTLGAAVAGAGSSKGSSGC